MKEKKIIILVTAIILLLIIMTSIGIIYKNKLAKTKEEKNSIEVNEQQILEVTNKVENEIAVQDEMIDNTAVVLQNVVNTPKINTTSAETKKEDTKEVEKATQSMETPKETQKQVVEKETSTTQEVTITKPVEETKTTTQQTPNIESKPVVNTSPVVSTPTEEYRYNDSMTQTMVNIINSNPSEYMKMDGFSVIVDSSITSLTNQFTFTEQRVINKIAQKAGTIRVYAQDYYYNGELLFTECYIF